MFYYLIQDLKVSCALCHCEARPDPQCFIFSLITLHFKIKPSECKLANLRSTRCMLTCSVQQ